MVSTPSYDPNPLASHNPDEQKKAWAGFTGTEGPGGWWNRAIQGRPTRPGRRSS